MKILILGNKGMLGHVVERYLMEKEYDVVGTDRTEVDVTDYESMRNKIIAIRPEVIINCTGALGPCKDKEKQVLVNICAPRYLQYLSKKLAWKPKIIHISTNCVFKDIGPHGIEEVPDATNLYGQCKAYGEIVDDHNLTIRTSITGPELKMGKGLNLFDWFVHQSPNPPDVADGYVNAFWNGVSTLELAKFIEACIRTQDGPIKADGLDPLKITGLIHFFSETVNKYDFVCMLNELYDLKKSIRPVVKQGIHSSILSDGRVSPRTIKDQFKEMKDWYKK